MSIFCGLFVYVRQMILLIHFQFLGLSHSIRSLHVMFECDACFNYTYQTSPIKKKLMSATLVTESAVKHRLNISGNKNVS